MVTVHCTIPEGVHVVPDILDVSGRRMIRLVDSVGEAGVHRVEWKGCNEDEAAVSSGIYFCRLTAGKKSVTRKMIIAR